MDKLTTKQIRTIVAYVYDYLENQADCSCSWDEYGSCWYHLLDHERIDFLTKGAERALENISNSNSIDY